MKIINTLKLLTILSYITCLMSCTDDSSRAQTMRAKILADSIAQVVIDNDSIDWYIQSHNIPIDSINIDVLTGVKYAILKRGNGTTPDLNAIVSIHYTGSFLNDKKFDTSRKSIALVTDSLAYVMAYANKDTTFNDILNNPKSLLNYEEKLDSLNNSRGKINISLYSLTKVYQPIVFNYTLNGYGISGFISGFSNGLTNVMNLKDNKGNQIFELGGKAIIFIPSGAAYGLSGSTPNLDGFQTIPPNTTLIFEFEIVNIRN